MNATGNTTAKGADTFTYDQPNQLKTATVSGMTETYTYDGDGTRFSRQVGASTPIRYVSDISRSLPVTIDDGSRKYVYGLGLAYAVSSSTVDVFHTDRLGSIRAITDATGATTSTYRTDEWGNPTSTIGSSSQPLHFTGEPQDTTGLTYLRARYYDSSLGQFMSRDTFGGAQCQPQSQNQYTYSADNPATEVDPTGHTAFAVGPAPAPPPMSPECEDLANKISDQVLTIREKFWDIINNTDLPYFPVAGSPSSVWTHQANYQGFIQGYDTSEQKWRDLGCPGGPPPLPSSYRTVPEPLRTPPGPNPLPIVGGEIGGGFAAYAAWRLIRLLPSLTPPGWPSLVPNLLVP